MAEAHTKRLGKQLRTEEFDLDENFVFCNSGAWSCVPRRLLERQNELIREREKNNQLWAFSTESGRIWESLTLLSEFIGARVENVTFIDNTTEGTNVALKNQVYESGDKILLCNVHAYGAVINQAKAVVQENEGVELVMFDIPFPIRGEDDIITAYREALEQNPGVKITVIDHISSNTAVLFPIKEIIELCHRHDVMTVIDGAHTPGQIKLTVEDYGADYYVGNLCKWLLLPQNAGFLWVNPKHQERTRPMMTSHFCFRPYFRERFYPPQTKNRIVQLLVKDALEFLDELGGLEYVSSRNSELATRAAEMLSREWKTDHLDVSRNCRAPHMAIIAYPEEMNEVYPHDRVIDIEYDLLMNGVNGKVVRFDGKIWCRISCHVWNDFEDFELLSERVKSMAAWKKAQPSNERPNVFIPEDRK